MSNVLHMDIICVTGVPNSQIISPLFALRPPVFELHAILRQVQQMLQITLNTNVYPICITSMPQSNCLAPRPCRVRDARLLKIANKHLTWTLNCQKYHIYEYRSVYNQSFSRSCIFYTSPNHRHVKKLQIEERLPKIHNLKSHNSFNNFGRDPPYEYTWCLESGSRVYFQGKCCLKVYFNMVPCQRKRIKKGKM